MIKKTLASLLAVVAIPFLAAACGPKAKAGDACAEEGKLKCAGDKFALVCINGKYESLACRGLNGCMSDSACTNNGYAESEPCVEEGNYQCTLDKKAMLVCKGKHFKTVEKCLGQNGCVANAAGAKCDNSISEANAPCEKEDTYACALDAKTMLRCTSGKLVPWSTCPGMHGCRKQFDQIECNGEQKIKK